MSPCVNHPAVAETQPCAGCQKQFCSDCLVELQGQQYCGACKTKFVRKMQRETVGFKKPKQALTYAIVGIFCFGIILEPVAFFMALSALKQIKKNPDLPGRGSALRTPRTSDGLPRTSGVRMRLSSSPRRSTSRRGSRRAGAAPFCTRCTS